MYKKHEQSIIDGFFKFLKYEAKERNINFISASLDGQDSLLNADYMFSNNIKFTLSEFKYLEEGIKTENKKDNALLLCRRLENDDVNRKKHLNCHYIAWSEIIDSDNYTIYFNSYSNEVCNLKIFNESQLKNEKPSKSERKSIDIFSNDFFNNKIGLDFRSFYFYIEWLLGVVDPSGGGSIELLVNDSSKGIFSMKGFKSLSELKVWMDSKSSGEASGGTEVMMN